MSRPSCILVSCWERPRFFRAQHGSPWSICCTIRCIWVRNWGGTGGGCGTTTFRPLRFDLVQKLRSDFRRNFLLSKNTHSFFFFCFLCRVSPNSNWYIGGVWHCFLRRVARGSNGMVTSLVRCGSHELCQFKGRCCFVGFGRCGNCMFCWYRFVFWCSQLDGWGVGH